MSSNNRIGIGKRIIVTLITLAACALLGEVILRLWAPFPDYSHEVIRSFPDRYDPYLGYAGIPNLDQPFILPDFRVTIRNNSRGFRDRERSYRKGDEKRIVLLGDSHAWGWGVENEENFPALLEEKLRGWEVINLGHAGYSTDQELLLLEREGMRYSPDIVLLLFCENDVKDAHSSVIDGFQPKPYFIEKRGRLVLENVPVPHDPAYWSKKRALSRTFAPERGTSGRLQRSLRKSHLYNWGRFRLGQFRAPARGPAKKAPTDENRRELGLNLRLLKRMDELCRNNGATLVVADIPSVYSPMIEGFCEKERIPCLGLGAALETRFRPTNFRRVGHWTPYGQRRVADALAAFLGKKKLLE